MNVRYPLLLALGVLTIVGSLSPGASAQTDSTLYSFTGGVDGRKPFSSLVMDAGGNLYGTTVVGGAFGAGAVYELTRGTGGWTESVLYSFTGGADGLNPYGADVIFDAAGNLYGTTWQGGTNNLGVVFELTPNGSGWTESVLHNFGAGADGQYPYAGLVIDSVGNLYGTTYRGGSQSAGAVFELIHGKSGWTEQVLHSFTDTDGDGPLGGLVFDGKGNLYGVTVGGGAYQSGVAFELVRTKGWKEIVLHNFKGGLDGRVPDAERLVLDAAGNLYGTTSGGGTFQLGVVFRLSPIGSGRWQEKVLFSFDGAVAANPLAGVILDDAGNLYGTCANGNGKSTGGAVFEVSPGAGDVWTERNLHLFDGLDGESPNAALLRDAAGNLYGTTTVGGAFANGVVFEVSP